MDTIIHLFWFSVIIWVVGFAISSAILIPILLLAFGLGASIQGIALAAAVPYVVAFIAPLPVMVILLVADAVEQNNRAYFNKFK